jgi:Putative amidase domain
LTTVPDGADDCTTMHRRLALFALSVLVLVFASLAFAAAAFAYNGAAAAVYADTYWQTYNTAWPSFATSGGDCTNFVSQALYAGGINMRTSPTYSGDAAWYMVKKRNRWSYAASWVNAEQQSTFMLQYLRGVSQVASYYGLAPGTTAADHAAQGDVVLYDWNNDGVYDHEAIVAASDGTNPDGTTNWDLVDAHTNNRYHAYWTLAQYNASWATTRIVVLHISPTTS